MLSSPLSRLAQRFGRDSRRRLSREDQTTGLPLLANLYPEIDRAVSRGDPVGVLFLDLVQFESLEKMLTPPARNHLLGAVGAMLREMVGKVLRAEDIASLGYGGGSDFMVFLTPPRTRDRLLEDQITEIGARVESYVSSGLRALETELSLPQMLKLKAGYARIEPAQLPIQVLVHEAIDQASGRARDAGWSDKQELLGELVPILRQRRVTTVYQPIVSLVDGSVAGFEALSRGPQDSRLGMPDQLFNAAEKLGLLEPLERLCWESALNGAARLPKLSRLFVNVSPEVVSDPVAAKKLLELDSIPPARIVVELTERHAIRDFEAFKRTLDMYRAHGFGIAMDDAGAGHSSLRAVAELRPEFMKIDMSLVRDIDHDRAKYALVAALTTFARRIDAVVVAEGIETSAEMNSLIEIGVPYGQGFLIARPDREFQRPGASLANVIRGQIELREKQVSGQVVWASDIAKPAESVPAGQLCRVAEEMFRANPSLQAIAVTEDHSVIGLISRDKFFGKLGSQYGYSIFASRPIREAMNPSGLIVEGSESMEVVSRKAVHRRAEDAYDHIIVTENGRLRGMLSVIDLLDITTRRQLSIAKYSNPLSGLPGNVLIQKETERRLQSRQPFVFCHIDLNHFKRYNDRYGFSAGDQVILLLARIIQQAIGTTSNFVGHIGGDDFVLLTEPDRATEMSQRIVHDFQEELASLAGGTRWKAANATLSMAAVTCEPGMSFAQISEEAFKTKKVAKAQGGNALVWGETIVGLSMHRQPLRRSRTASVTSKQPAVSKAEDPLAMPA